LHPLEKYTCLEHCLTKIICNFEILLLLAAGALCSCRAHTASKHHSPAAGATQGYGVYLRNVGGNFKGHTVNKK